MVHGIKFDPKIPEEDDRGKCGNWPRKDGIHGFGGRWFWRRLLTGNVLNRKLVPPDLAVKFFHFFEGN